jgi:NifB/MoaA-like Fe-S oxidoreductase
MAANRRRLKQNLIYPSDEWYLVAGRELPAANEYDGFPQVENGVGMVRQLLDEWKTFRSKPFPSARAEVVLVCGTLIAPVMGQIVAEWNALAGGGVRLVPVVNQYFGAVTTVSGLLTGQDVVAALQNGLPNHASALGRDSEKVKLLGDVVLLPRAMFTGRYGAGSSPPGVTLDDLSISDISARLGVRVEMAGTLTEAQAVVAGLAERG